MSLVKSESGSDVAEFMNTRIGENIRSQIRSIATDQPNAVLLKQLKTVLPNLNIMCLDPVHTVMSYKQAFWKKSSPGQGVLRRIQNKFNKVNLSVPSSDYGCVFNGSEHISSTRSGGINA